MSISELIHQLEHAQAEYGDLPVIIDNGDPEYYSDTSHGTTVVTVAADDNLRRPKNGEDTEDAFCINLF